MGEVNVDFIDNTNVIEVTLGESTNGAGSSAVSRAYTDARINRLVVDVTAPELAGGVQVIDTVADALSDSQQLAAVSAAFDFAADGARIVFPKTIIRIKGDDSGSPLITNLASNGTSRKTLHVEGKETMFIVDSDNIAMNFQGGWETTYSIIGSPIIIPATFDDQSWSLQVTVNGDVSQWHIGDKVKIFGSDLIPDSRNPIDRTTSGVTKSYAARVGQFMVVESATLGSGSQTTVVMRGKLRDTFTSNLKIARMSTAGMGSSITDVVFDMSPQAISDGHSNAMVTLRSLVDPNFDFTVARNLTAAVSATSCYGGRGRLEVGFAMDDVPAGHTGYGMFDAQCEGFELYDSRFRYVRHGFTTIHSDIPPDYTDPAGYGRSTGGKVHDCYVESSSSAGLDTHYGAELFDFHNNTVVNARYAGFGMRGRYNSVRDCVAQDCEVGVIIFTEDTNGGGTHGMLVDGLTVRGARKAAVDVVINPSGHRNAAGVVDAGTRDTRVNATLRNITNDGEPVVGIIRAQNAIIQVDPPTLALVDVLSNSQVIRLDNVDEAERLEDSPAASNTTGPLLDDILKVWMPANATYDLDALLAYDAGATDDILFSWSMPDGCQGTYTLDAMATSLTTTVGAQQVITSLMKLLTSSYAAGGLANITLAARASGSVRNGSTAGYFQLQYGKNGSAQGSETAMMKPGSKIVLRRKS